jgi:hypothetical protein
MEWSTGDATILVTKSVPAMEHPRGSDDGKNDHPDDLHVLVEAWVARESNLNLRIKSAT